MKKHEWSKIFCGLIAGGFGVYGVWCGTEYYRLAEIAATIGGQMPDPVLAVTCVSMIMASLLSYLLYQMGLKNSRNKYGVDANGMPYRTMPSREEVLMEAAAEAAANAGEEADNKNYTIPGFFGDDGADSVDVKEEDASVTDGDTAGAFNEDEPVG